MGITRQQALDCFASDDLIGIGMEADAVRRSLHPESAVSYTIDHALDCGELDLEKLSECVATAFDLGATCLRIQADSSRAPSLDHCEAVLKLVKNRFPVVQLSGLSATEIIALTARSGSDLASTVTRLRDSGLATISSNAVILSDDLRSQHSPRKCTVADWLAVHRTAHQLGMPTAATMVYGVGETMEQRVDHLESIRVLQDEAGGFTDFTPLVSVRENQLEEPTAVEYLKTLAISRLYLDNIPHLQASWQTQSLKVLQMALRFGSNDVGAVLLEQHNGRPGGATEEELRRVIREAGFRPVQRDTLYRKLFLD